MKFKIDMTSGNVDATRVDCGQMQIDMTSGGIDLDGFTGELDANSTSGNLVVRYDETMDDLRFDGTSGNVTIYYTNVDDIDATFNMETTSGNIKK